MQILPREIKLGIHARQRLLERRSEDSKYNLRNLIKSPCKWYGKNDLIYNCALYKHSCYVTRKDNTLVYLTDGNIEVIYNKNTKLIVTILEVKEKFKPITQYLKPEFLKIKGEVKK